MSSIACKTCGVAFTPEHPAQTVCRACVTPRCPICRWYLDAPNTTRDRVYCSNRCRQRARAGAKYTIMGRDAYTCQRCGQKYDENNPQEMKRLAVKMLDPSGEAVAINAATFCERCEPTGLPPGLGSELLRRTTFFKIDPNQPLGPISRQDMRRRHRK